jgi:hypothetical protein
MQRDGLYYKKFLFKTNRISTLRPRKLARLHKMRGSILSTQVPFVFRRLQFEKLRKLTASQSARQLSGEAGVFSQNLLHRHFDTYSPLFQKRYFEMFNPYIRVNNRVVGLPLQDARRTVFK